MRRKKRIDIRYEHENRELIAQLEPMFQDSGATIDQYPVASENLIIVIVKNLYSDIDAYNSLYSYIHENKLNYNEYEYREYSKKDLNEGLYFDVRLRYPWEHISNEAKDNGTQYDDRNKCQLCGQGVYQITDLIIDTKKIGKQNIVYNYPDIIVTEHTKRVIEENNLTGCRFRNVFDRKDRDLTRYFQLIPNAVLGPMNIRQMKIDKHRYCDACFRGAVLRSEIVYSGASMTRAEDFNKSLEFYGFGSYCTPRLIVSSKVREIFKKNQIKVFEYEPIVIN
ncbi:hypothetical protein D3C84_773950 [compost metagenome]